MNEKQRIVVNTVANGVAQFAGMLTALVFMPFLIRGFGATNYGLYLITSSIAGYASLLDLGVGSSVVKLTAEALASNDRRKLSETVSTALVFYVLIGIAAAGIMVILALNAQHLFRVTPDGARLLRGLLLVASAWSLISWPAVTFNAVLQGHQRYTQTSAIALAGVLGNVAVTVGVLVSHQGPFALLVGTYSVSLLMAVAQYVLARRALGSESPVTLRHANLRSFRSVFSLAWAVFVLQVSGVIVYQQTDRMVLAVAIGAAAVALYEAAGKFQGLISQLTAFTVSAVLPLASQLDSEGRQESLRQLFLRGTKYSLMLLTPVVIVLIVVARPLLLTWLGATFAAQALAAQVLISHQLLTSGVAVGDSMILGRGKLSKRVPYAVTVAALNLAISVILVQRLGIMGVVLGTTIPWLLDYPFHMRLILKSLDVPLSRWLKQTVLPVYPLLLLPALLSWWLISTPLRDSLLGIAFVGIASVGVYWIAVYLFGFEPHEREDVRGGIRAAWARATGRA